MGLFRRRWLVGATLVVVLAAVGVELRYYRRALSLCHPTRVPITDADRAAVRARLPESEEVSFTTDDGVVLRAFYMPSHNGRVLIMGHGLGENRMRWLPDAEMLARHGYGALFFDWRAHGDSGGDTATWGDREQRDFRAAVDFASRRPDVVPGGIAGLGFSVGSTGVLLEAVGDPRVRAVILEAIWTSLVDELRNKFFRLGPVSAWAAIRAFEHAGVQPDNVRALDHVAELRRPLLIINGTLDTDTPVAVSRRVFDAAAQPKELWIVEGSEHGMYAQVAPVEYERRILRFLDDAFAAQRP